MTSFKEVIAQSRSIRILESFLLKGNLPQSLLLEGEAGLGKRKAAEIFSGAVMCHADAPGRIEACGQCIACQKMRGQNHPDFSILAPDGNTIKIDAIRKMQEGLIYTPVDGRKKIVIIDPAEKMNAAAANALLKTLEEPPPYVMLILVSGKPGMLLPTLRSRCQKVLFQPLSFFQVVEALLAEKHWEDSEARFVAAMTFGRLQEAMNMDLDAAREIELRYFKLVSDEDLFETAANFSGSAEVFEPALLYLMTWLRDVLVFKSLENTSPCDADLLRYAWRADDIRAWADFLDIHEIEGLLSDLQKIHLAQSRNVNRQLSLETFLLRLRKNKSLLKLSKK
jgi:DNA polymerase-3 subunit delta'